MKDQLVTFETAKLAKEKGFNIPTTSAYIDKKIVRKTEELYGYIEGYIVGDEDLTEQWNSNWVYTNIGEGCFGCSNNPKYHEAFSAPTQSLLQKWIREEKLITIKIDDFYHNSRVMYDYHVGNLGHQDDNPQGMFGSYEDAIEVALVEALNKEIE